MTESDVHSLRRTAAHLRGQIIRMVAAAGSGHPGGSLSAIDVIAYLYFRHMRIRPEEPAWEGRDRFVLSKGHCAPAVYAALAERGFFPADMLWTLRDLGSKLQGHPDMRKTPGIDITTGSLGQGFSCATGMALGAKAQGRDFRVFAMVGDGEMQEGVVWEAAMAAVHYRLDNLVAIVDNNGLQTDGFTADIMGVERIEQKFAGFGWETLRIDGHSFEQIENAFLWAGERKGRPHVIVAETVKGKGIREMENQPAWHALGKPLEPAQVETFLAELEVL
jgi:transketolase